MIVIFAGFQDLVVSGAPCGLSTFPTFPEELGFVWKPIMTGPIEALSAQRNPRGGDGQILAPIVLKSLSHGTKKAPDRELVDGDFESSEPRSRRGGSLA